MSTQEPCAPRAPTVARSASGAGPLDQGAVHGGARAREGFAATFAAHWPEYVIELAGLAWVMLAAGLIASLLWYERSPLHSVIASEPCAER